MPNKLLTAFRTYLVILALVAHVALFAIVALAIINGPEHVVTQFRYATHAVGERLKKRAQMVQAAEEAQIVAQLGEPSRTVFGYRDMPLTVTDKLGRGRVFQVGPQREFKTPSSVAWRVRDGDVVEIDAGVYRGDSIVWFTNNLTIRAVGGVATLDAAGAALAEGKAIWVVRATNVRIENVEFSSAHSRDENGSGIRAEGSELHVVSCYFHDNDSGLMSDNRRDNSIHIEQSEFNHNGSRSGQSHQIYIGSIDRFVLEASYVHDTFSGSAVKSRAHYSTINYNRIVDERSGRSNYTIDLSSGGDARVIGNVLQQGPFTENETMVTFAPEGQDWPENKLLLAHNTLVSDAKRGNFVYNHSTTPIHAYNNLFLGDASPMEGTAILSGNLVDQRHGLFGKFDESLGGLAGSTGNIFAADAGVISRRSYDYHLTASSPAVKAAVPVPTAMANSAVPTSEYFEPLGTRPRTSALDVGAFESSPIASQ
jgi:hypothetical protein